MSDHTSEQAWLLLHGFTGTPNSFAEITSALSPGRWLAPTLTGHGPVPFARSKSFEAELERLAKLVREHFAPPVRLMGYSMGARLGLGLLIRYPELFANAILIGVNPGLESELLRERRRSEEARLVALLRQRGVAGFVDDWRSQPLFATQKRLPTRLLAEQQRTRLSHTADGLCLALTALGLGNMPSYWNKLPELDVPLDIVVGELDEKFECLGRRMLKALPRAQLWRAPRTGHNVLLEAHEFLRQLLEQPIATE